MFAANSDYNLYFGHFYIMVLTYVFNANLDDVMSQVDTLQKTNNTFKVTMVTMVITLALNGTTLLKTFPTLRLVFPSCIVILFDFM